MNCSSKTMHGISEPITEEEENMVNVEVNNQLTKEEVHDKVKEAIA